MCESAEMWRMRAMACELLAASFRYPDPALAQAVCSGEWLRAAEEAGFGAVVDACDESLDEGLDADALLHHLRIEATRLFVGAPRARVWAYEGPARAAGEGIEPVMFVSAHTRGVEDFCRACGFAGSGRSNEPLDYVSTELELLQNLAVVAFADLSGATLEGGTMESAAFPGGSAATAYELFWNEHAARWLPAFADAVLADADTAFYRVSARLVQEFASR